MSSYRDFRAFLRREDCEEAFDRAFYLYNDCTMLDASLWEAGSEEYIIGHAFDWAKTFEGRSFWAEIDRRWYAEAAVRPCGHR